MTVRYHDGSGAARSAHGYVCAFYQVNYGTGGSCQRIAGPALDAYITGQVLEAVAPAALEVSMTAAAQAEDERAMLDKLWRQRLERARYAPTAPAASTSSPSRKTASSPGSWKPAGGGLPAVHRGTAQDPQRSGTRGDSGPGC